MRSFIIWTTYILSIPFLIFTCIGIVLTYLFYYPSSFLRNFSEELHKNEYTSYKRALNKAMSQAGKKDLF